MAAKKLLAFGDRLQHMLYEVICAPSPTVLENQTLQNSCLVWGGSPFRTAHRGSSDPKLGTG